MHRLEEVENAFPACLALLHCNGLGGVDDVDDGDNKDFQVFNSVL